MNSPFPGMDPYLEAHWGDVHTTLMVYARNRLNAQVPDGLQARVEEGVAVAENGDTARIVYPDVHVVEESCVRRATQRRQAELYPAPLRQPLPNIPVPLRPDDKDAVLQLQALLDDCYRDGRYQHLDYRGELMPPLEANDARWAEGILREKGLR